MPHNYRGYMLPNIGERNWGQMVTDHFHTVIDYMLDVLSGQVFITDIEPLDSGAVYDKLYFDEGYTLRTCTTSAKKIRVHVYSISGNTQIQPVATVNGLPSNMGDAWRITDIPLFWLVWRSGLFHLSICGFWEHRGELRTSVSIP